MSRIISEQTALRIADLSRLKLSEDQLERYRKQLADVLGHISRLEELDVEGVEPMAHPLPITNHLDEDVIEPSLPVERLLDLAPTTEGHFLTVPKVIDGAGG